jgi:hypothetical protein
VGASDKFSLYDPHADTHSRERNPLLFFIAEGMKFMLISVFAFFGLHTILWLVRSLILRRRIQPTGKAP